MGSKKIILIVRIILIVIFCVLAVRLFELQIIRGSYYKELADGNRIRKVVIKAPRGEILARGGEYLARNDEVDDFVLYNRQKGYFVSDTVDKNSQKISDVKTWNRSYPLRAATSQVTGYVGMVNQAEVGKTDTQCIDLGPHLSTDEIGRSGLEEYYDCKLRGTDGEKLLEVNADGSYVRELGQKDPVKGLDLKTTIDYPLQQYVSTLISGSRGIIVVSDAKGEILALYSSPSYDPNVFLNNSKKAGEVLKDKDLPLFNRVISGKYSPGSIFKPIVATAALESGAIDKNYHYQDTGVLKLSTIYGDYSYSNWYFTQYGGVEGSIDVTRAIARSTDTFFYKVGELTGISKLAQWSKMFGLGQKTGIDLPGEVSGLVPDPQWKEETKGEQWFLGNTYHFSIGQGDLEVTPIGIHSAITAIANGGELCKPRIVSSDKPDESYCSSLGINDKNISIVKEGMVEACSSGGTGYTFFDFKQKHKIDVACKTGTAQIGTDKTNAWFTAFAPSKDPQIVVTVLVEEGGEGSKVAGPIARQVFDFWFNTHGTN